MRVVEKNHDSQTEKNFNSDYIQDLAIRFFDIVLATLALIFLFPVLMVIGLAIKTNSPGKILLNQSRVGQGGIIFKMLKFRTMYSGTKSSTKHYRRNEGGTLEPVIKVRNDDRVTRIGKFLRKFSLDELPQFINVIKGDMSLVGPRPPVVEEAKIYDGHQWRRLSGKPGLTGLAQISGRTDLSFDKIVKLDMYYLKNRSVWLYLKILILTIPYFLLGKSSY